MDSIFENNNNKKRTLIKTEDNVLLEFSFWLIFATQLCVLSFWSNGETTLCFPLCKSESLFFSPVVIRITAL